MAVHVFCLQAEAKDQQDNAKTFPCALLVERVEVPCALIPMCVERVKVMTMSMYIDIDIDIDIDVDIGLYECSRHRHRCRQ